MSGSVDFYSRFFSGLRWFTDVREMYKKESFCFVNKWRVSDFGHVTECLPGNGGEKGEIMFRMYREGWNARKWRNNRKRTWTSEYKNRRLILLLLPLLHTSGESASRGDLQVGRCYRCSQVFTSVKFISVLTSTSRSLAFLPITTPTTTDAGYMAPLQPAQSFSALLPGLGKAWS